LLESAFLERSVRPACLDARGQRLGDSGEAQRRDHTELAAAGAAQSPEQVGFVVVVALHDAAICEHHLCADKAIARQPVLASEQAYPAAQGEARDADTGTAAARQGAAIGVQRRVHLAQAGTGSDRGDPVRCHGDAIEARQVQHDPVRRRSTCEAMASATGDDAFPRCFRVRDGADDVRDGATQHHEPGTHLPVGGVHRAADRFVARRVRAEQLAVERIAERGQIGHEFDTMSGVMIGLERIEHGQTRIGGLLRVARKGL